MSTNILKVLIWVVKNFYYPNLKSIPSEIIVAQALLETGNFTSNIFKENKNLFGMKKASVRKHYATGENRGHATYKNYLDSVKDYFARVADFKNTYALYKEDYYLFLQKTGYAEDKSYIDKLKKIARTLSPSDYNFVPFLLIPLFFLGYIGS